MNAGEWRRQAQAAFLRRCLEDGKPQIFDAPEMENLHPNHAGLAVRALADAGLVRNAGFAQSKKPSRKGGVQRKWRVRDSKATARFLEWAERPDPQMDLPGMDS